MGDREESAVSAYTPGGRADDPIRAHRAWFEKIITRYRTIRSLEVELAAELRLADALEQPSLRRDAAIAEAWKPACMDADELATWAKSNEHVPNKTDRAAGPCSDCLLEFAIEMRAAGRCNGTPRGIEEDEKKRISDLERALRDARASAQDIPVLASYRAWFGPSRTWFDDPPASDTQADLAGLLGWPLPAEPSASDSGRSRRFPVFGEDVGGPWVRLTTRSGDQRVIRDPAKIWHLEVSHRAAPAWVLVGLPRRSREGHNLARALAYRALVRSGRGAREAARVLLIWESELDAPWRDPDAVADWAWQMLWGIRLQGKSARRMRAAESTIIATARRARRALGQLDQAA